MFVLLIIVVLSVLALWLSNAERKHPAALVMTGLLSIAIGGRAVAVFADDVAPAIEVDLREEDRSITGQAAVSEAESAAIATSSVAKREQPRELAVEPTPTFRYLTTPRPDWVETEAVKGDQFYQVAVESGLHVRRQTARQALRDEVKGTVDAFVKDYLGSELAPTLAGYSIEESEAGAARTISLWLDGTTYEIGREQFEEQVEFDYGVMNQSHTLIKIDENLKDALDQRWSKVRATSRLFQTGLGAGAVLLLLGTMFSYLKLDTATRGYYTGRLQFGAAAAILAVIAVCVVCANKIPWM